MQKAALLPMELSNGPQRKTNIHKIFLNSLSFTLAILLLYIFYTFASVGNGSYIKFFRYETQQMDSRHYRRYFDDQEVPTITRNYPTKEGYLVWTPQCRIPDINPLHKSIKKVIEIQETVLCSSVPLLTKIEKDSLVVVQEAVQHYDPKKKISCCYQEVVRNSSNMPLGENPDDYFWLTPCKTFKNSIQLLGQEYIMVKCYSNKRKSKKEVYRNMHANIKINTEARYKIEKSEGNKEKMNVLLIGFDSISRLNLIRSMPRTVLFLKSQGWVDLRGYNKMEDNTCPNFLAILTGLSPKEIRKYCFPKNNETFDKAPFIWKDFSDQGYITAYAEDEQWIGTFNYHKRGFVKPPTDYYLRHFMLAGEKNMKIKKVDGLKYCLGPTSSSDHILRYAFDFCNLFKNNSFFGLFWMNSFSHNNLNTASSMDLRILQFFEKITESGALDNTFVVFLSDHGMRFGPIRETYVGWMEERLPFIYLWIPQWYKDKYPHNFSNLINSGGKLTSPYDLHLTLRHILNNSTKQLDYCPKCMSLFRNVPWNRSCKDVGVTEHWCTCTEYKKLPIDSPVTKPLSEFIITTINVLLANSKNVVANNSKCATLSIHRILSIKIKAQEFQNDYNDYKLIFETSPGDALFEASIREGSKFTLLDAISRINFYDSQSKCVSDAIMKKYCFCIYV
uniref:Uncharacterized protein n=1 Tax=Clastoptera arizonana TaxID=38151 RepID=A0A1B6C5Q2_9HEMI